LVAAGGGGGRLRGPAALLALRLDVAGAGAPRPGGGPGDRPGPPARDALRGVLPQPRGGRPPPGRVPGAPARRQLPALPALPDPALGRLPPPLARTRPQPH